MNKLVSRASLGFALALGMLATGVATPALAAKEKPAAGPTPQLGKEFRAAIGAAQAAIKAGNAADGAAKLAVAEPLAQQPDEKYYLGVMRYDLSKLTKDNASARKAVNEMISSGSKLSPDPAELNFVAGNLAYAAGDYPDAAAKFAEADRLGSKNVDRLLLLAEADFKLNKFPEGLAAVDKAVNEETAAGRKPPESWFQRAASIAYKSKNAPELAKWTRAQVKAYPTAENWRSALVTYRDGARIEGQQLLDLMRLMRLTKSLAGERDYYEYASGAIDRALPGEAKSTIEEGFASGAVNKSSRPVAEILTIATGKIAADRASLAASEKQASGAPTGKVAKGTADGFLGYGEDAKAIALYRTALQKGGVDNDEVNTRLGIALARSGQKEEARKAFGAVTSSPRADIAKFWLLYLDTTA